MKRGKSNAEGRSLTYRAGYLNVAVMLLNDLVCDGQTQAGSCVHRACVSGRKEWIEDVLQVFGCDSMSGIFDVDLHEEGTLWFLELMRPYP